MAGPHWTRPQHHPLAVDRLSPPGGPLPHLAVATTAATCDLADIGVSDPRLDTPADLPRRWAVVAPLVALAPLVTYRLLEFTTSSWSTPWGPVAEHTLPPLCMLAVTVLLWRQIPPLPGQRDAPPFGGVGVSVAVGVLVGTGAALMNLLMMLAARTEIGAQGMASIDPGAAALVAHVVLLAPVAEEFAFRGLIYRIFRQNMLPWSATLLCALIFGLMHVQLSKAVWAFFLGLITAVSYEQTRSLLTPILIHALFNAVPIGVAVLRAKPDDTGPIWLVLALVGVIFSLSARSARRSSEDTLTH